MYNRNRFASAPVSVRSIVPLEDNNLRRLAPSVFATQPWERMSSRYRFVPTIDVVNEMRANGFMPIRAFQSRTRIEGKGEFTKHMLRFRHNSFLNNIAVGDEIPEIALINAHDGASAYKLYGGFFRLACLNGMVVKTSDFGDISVRHSGSEDLPSRVIDASFQIINDMPKVIKQVEAWKQIALPAPAQQKFAEGVAQIMDNDKVNPSDLLRPRRYEDRPEVDGTRSLWKTFNTAQENVIKGGVPQPRTPSGRRSTTRQIKDIGRDVKINRDLWDLASKVAELVG